MRVSLAFRPNTPAGINAVPGAECLVAPSGPAIVLGQPPSADALAQPIVPSRCALFGPRGAAINVATGGLAIADTGHHRLMIWHEWPKGDHAKAAIQIGQPDFGTEGRNGKRSVGAATLNVPTGVATDGQILAVADAWNHRILIWKDWPSHSNQPADLVLGQRDFVSNAANRGGAVSSATLNWCYGLSLAEGKLLVADTGNRRVLIWNRLPEENGQPADIVVGQKDFECRDENAGEGASAVGMRWPHSIVMDNGRLLITDAGNNRVMVWDEMPDAPGAPCDFILGQRSFVDIDHNRGRYLPDECALNMPYGLCTAGPWLIAADTANSRLVAWRRAAVRMGAPATGLAGQSNFAAKGDNRWQAPTRDSLCWPYAVNAARGSLAVVDSGNNRVALWELAAC